VTVFRHRGFSSAGGALGGLGGGCWGMGGGLTGCSTAGYCWTSARCPVSDAVVYLGSLGDMLAATAPVTP
jgi:hypothetical protein